LKGSRGERRTASKSILSITTTGGKKERGSQTNKPLPEGNELNPEGVMNRDPGYRQNYVEGERLGDGRGGKSGGKDCVHRYQ